MKKLLSVFFALAFYSTAHSENYLSIQYSGIDGADVDGYSIIYTSVNDNISLQSGVVLVDANDSEVSSTLALSVDAGMQSFEIGTLYAGGDLFFSDDGNSDETITIGYSKRKIDELSYDFSVSQNDGESTYAALMRIPLTNGGGVLIGMADNDLLSTYTIGYSIGF